MTVTHGGNRDWPATIAAAAALADLADPGHPAGWLLLAALEADPPAEGDDPRAWGPTLERLALRPWTAETDPMTDQVLRASDERVRRAVEEFRQACQQRESDRERAAVATEVRRIVAMSGLSQRAFAARIGTSASRLSSYVHGHVVPSATMMLRIKRAERLRQLAREVSRAS
jgi:DNA-binding transcriptional regulator YiaG